MLGIGYHNVRTVSDPEEKVILAIVVPPLEERGQNFCGKERQVR